jgi:hypothetical protein
MKHGSVGIAALACLALAACATPAPPPPPLLAVSGADCSATPDLSKAASLQLPAKAGDEKPVAVTFDGETACLLSAAGSKSFYRIFALPSDAPPYTILISSQPFGYGIFAPHLMMLDNAGAVTREIKSGAFVFRGNELTALLRSHAEERYLLVASDPDSLGKQFARITEQTQVYAGSTGTAIYEIHTGTDTNNQLIYTANGKVSVTLALLPPPQKPK